MEGKNNLQNTMREKDRDHNKLRTIQALLEGTDQAAHFELFLAPSMNFSHHNLRVGYQVMKTELQQISLRRKDLTRKAVHVRGLLLETYRALTLELDNRNRKPKEPEDETTSDESEDERKSNSIETRPPKKRFIQTLQERRQSKRQAAKAALDNEKPPSYGDGLAKRQKKASTTATVEQTICAAGGLCKMPPNTPLDGKHSCKTCKLLLHGCMCRVDQTEFEEDENICYCLKCGRPGENDPPPPPKLPPPPPPPKLPPQKRYNTREQETKTRRRPPQDNPYAKQYSNTMRRTPKLPLCRGRQKKTAAKAAAKKNAAKTTPKQANAVETRVVNQKNGVNRRSVHSRPSSVSCLKDCTVKYKFTSCAKNISKLQFCNTMASEKSRNFLPKSQHFMYTYDELVQKPHNAKDSLVARDDPVHIFLMPEGVDFEKLGEQLINVGKEMMKKKKSAKGKGYIFTRNYEEYIELVFGKKKKRKPKGKN